MRRTRRAGRSALALVLFLIALVAVPVPATAGPVTWPPSSLVVSEVQTGGASASDEFVEIANQGTAPVDLIGLEIVYATSTGSTVTRKGTWAVSTLLAVGQRTVIANSSTAVNTIHPIGNRPKAAPKPVAATAAFQGMP